MSAEEEKKALLIVNELGQRLAKLESTHKANHPLLNQLQLLKTNLHNSKEYLSTKNHRVAFIGPVGVGKTTAICGILGLLDEKRNTLLDAASGRTTLCEVEIQRGKTNRILITPCSKAELNGYLRDFVEVLRLRHEGRAKNEDETIDLSNEVERCLRNMINLRRRHSRSLQGKKDELNPANTDEALELYKTIRDPGEFLKEIKNRLKADDRTVTEILCLDNDFPGWLKKNFSEINQGKNPSIPMPKKITIEIEKPLFGASHLEIQIVDTKGLDGNVEREDLDEKFQDSRTICIACSGFNDAPEQAILDLFKHLTESGLENQISAQALLLVLDRNEEAAEVLGEEGQVSSIDEGRSVRLSQIEDVFRNKLKMSDHQFPKLCFFNAKNETNLKASAHLLSIVEGLRRRRIQTIHEVRGAIEEIEKNREKAQAQSAFEVVFRAIHSWSQTSRKQLAEVHQIYKALVDDMANKEIYASSIRASVNREGTWFNFDFYYKLAVAARKKAVRSFGDSVSEIKSVLSNFERQPEMRATHPFIRQLLQAVDDNMEKIYEVAANKGRNVFESKLKEDELFWGKQKKEWGQGPGYKNRIAFGTDSWFRQNASSRQEQEIQTRIMADWHKFVDLIESLASKSKPVI